MTVVPFLAKFGVNEFVESNSIGSNFYKLSLQYSRGGYQQSVKSVYVSGSDLNLKNKDTKAELRFREKLACKYFEENFETHARDLPGSQILFYVKMQSAFS